MRLSRIQPQAHEIETEAVKAFKATGRNPYRAEPRAIADGKALYEAHCQTCHGPNATGKTGPSLVAEEYTYPRVATDIDMFEIIEVGHQV